MEGFRYLLLLTMFAPVGVAWGQSSTFMRDDGSEATESKRSMILSESIDLESERYVPGSEATTEKQARERRMAEVSTSNYKFYEIGDRRTVNISAKSMGIVHVQSFRDGGDRAKEELKQLLNLNRDMLGGIKLDNYTFEIEQTQSFGNAVVVRFHQLINGVQLPTSTLAITKSGEAKTLLLDTSSGSSQHFDKSMWLSMKEATALFRDLIIRDYGEFKPEYVILAMQLRAVRNDEGAGHIVVFQMGYAATIYQINAISGALYKKQSTLQSERHCQRDSGNPVHCGY